MKKRIFTAAVATCILLTGCNNSSEQTSGSNSSEQTSGSSSSATASESIATTSGQEISVPDETTTSAQSDAPSAEPPSTEPQFTAEADTYEPQLAETTVHAEYAEGAVDTEHDEYMVGDEESRTMLLFTAEKTVTDFKVLALTSFDFDENGNTSFSTETVYEQPELTPDRPLLAGLVFLGDIPNNGISYVDENGVEKRYAVDMSGMDGSLFLWEF